ncbi:MAG: DEAD/DEAH box helicase family protein [Wenzhouxiangellaceae bacterium]|nr:DEAD/DEAH box helicase family protein [Wenzhouxiangellaceae bacterium]
MTNFAFLPKRFSEIAVAATKAEGHIHGDPRAACFHARFALEAALHWLYRFEGRLNQPYDRNLAALLYENSLRRVMDERVFQKAQLIHKIGNKAAHDRASVSVGEAMQAVRDLHHFCYWLTRTYAPNHSRDGAAWRDERVPAAVAEDVVPRERLVELEQELEKRSAAELKRQQEADVQNAKIKAMQEEIARLREQAEAIPDTHDYGEAETRRHLIDVDLNRAGWKLDSPRDREYEVQGMPNARGVGYADYVLWGDDGKPLGVVEAKKTTVDPTAGRQQAKLYADGLEQMHGQRPLIFYTNGYETWLWDDAFYPPRKVAGFYRKDELERLIRRRDSRQPLDVGKVREAIAGRYYQKRAIGSICAGLTRGQRKSLLVMATGTGKTRTAIALVDLLQRANWVKRVLFLADRVSLVRQACGAFKAHLPESSPVNLVTEKNTDGRVYVCTYPTMMGLIEKATEGRGEARFGVGYFDLIIIDEAHRSVYQKYRAIFDYFDSLLVGLTATPREQVDRNTYELFDLEPGVPTDAYELDTAVRDGFLVPPRVQQVDLRFPREGIDYDDLSEEEKAHWESLDWGDDVAEDGLPDKVSAAAINSWLFNQDTVDKTLQHLMEQGTRVAGGDRLGKTIIFARNHEHAAFIEARFNHHYPEYKGQFARVIDNYASYAQSLIDDFSQVHKAPHIAISVDMLDTGIDIPEVVNLVFFKPVYSKIKFWQMIGRGTRLCPDLFGPGMDKENFRVFDFCYNFDFFKENPDGIEGSGGVPLGTRLFRARVDLLGQLQNQPERDDGLELEIGLADQLHAEVAAMNRNNFIVRMHLEAVEHFQKREAWERLSDQDRQELSQHLAALPSQFETDDVESRLFDLTALKMQLALLEGDPNLFEKQRQRVVRVAELLEDKTAIPAVVQQGDYLQTIQTPEFWEGMTLDLLEDMRRRVRGLVPFIDRQKRNVVYSNLQDEILGTRDGEVIAMPRITGAQYEKKVREYLRNHLDNVVIQRLRSNQPLTKTNLEELQTMLVQIGEDEGETLLSDLLARSQAPSLVHFVRSLVGMDRAAVQAAFSQFLSDESLSARQIRFVELIIDQLSQNGVIEAKALYEAPFSTLHSEGPEALFAGRENVVDGLFGTLKQLEPRGPDVSRSQTA